MSSKKKSSELEPRYRSGRLLCDAQGKRGQGLCGAFAVKGSTKCHHHGGAKGSGRPCITGKYSTVRAQQLAAKMGAAEQDPQLFNQQKRVAFLQGLWEEAVEHMLSLGEDDPALLWKSALNAFNDLELAITAQNAKVVKLALTELKRILKNGRAVQAAEEKARGLVQDIAAVSAVQYKGRKIAQEVLTAQEQQLYTARVISQIRAERDLPEEYKRLFAAILIRAASA